MDKTYTYSFNELANLISKDKNIKEGNYHFDITYHTDDEDKFMVVKVSPPKDALCEGVENE